MAEVVYSEEAIGDLRRVMEFVEGAGAEVAALIVEAVELLARHPFLGRPVEQGLRELVISRGRTGYGALYRVVETEDVVLVLGVRHQRDQRELGWV